MGPSFSFAFSYLAIAAIMPFIIMGNAATVPTIGSFTILCITAAAVLTYRTLFIT
jgi:hypothetical protein